MAMLCGSKERDREMWKKMLSGLYATEWMDKCGTVRVSCMDVISSFFAFCKKIKNKNDNYLVSRSTAANVPIDHINGDTSQINGYVWYKNLSFFFVLCKNHMNNLWEKNELR